MQPNDIESYKQMDDLMCEEANVHVLARHLGHTEEGELLLNYNSDTRTYTLELPKRTVTPKEETLLKILEDAYRPQHSVKKSQY